MEPGRALRLGVPAIAAAAAVVLLGVAAAPASALTGLPRLPKPITVSSNGEKPNVLVDQIGTAHVVWNESKPLGAPDVMHYCRIPRGARACTGEQTFVPPEPDPGYNKDNPGPRIVQTSPDEIVLLTHRYPPVVVSNDPEGTPNPHCYEQNPQNLERCFGSSNNSTWAYVSDDGGDSFAPPKLLGTGRLSGPPIALTAGFDAPRIAMVSDTETGGTFFQAVRPDGYSHAMANLGDEGRDRAYSGSVAAFNDALPVVAFSDLTPTVYVRAYRGGPTNDSTSWRTAVTVGPGEDPRLAGGPRGMYLLYKTRAQTGARYILKRVLDPTGQVSAQSTPVSEIGDVVGRDLFEDGGGGLHTAWVLRSGTGNALQYRFWPSAGALGAARTLAKGDINGVDLSAADDGGGLAVWSTATGNGVVQAVPFGPTTPLVDVRVTGIEVTQAVQSFVLPARDPKNPSAPVPYSGALLEASGQTIVRVYANSRGPLPAGTAPPIVTLRGFHNGRELGGGPSTVGMLPDFLPAGLATGALAEVPLSARVDPKGAYVFTVPWQWAQGSVTFAAEINPPGLMPAIGECARCHADNVFTLSGVPFRNTTRIRILPIALRVNGRLPKDYPNPVPVFDGLVATSPLHIDVQPYQAVYDATDIENDPGLNRSEKSADALDLVEDWSEDNNDELSSVYPVGIFPGGIKIGGLTNGEGELYGEDQPQSVVGDTRPLTEAAHEVGHGIGREHAGQNCDQTRVGDDQQGEFWPPDNMGLLDGIGLDRRVPPPYMMVAPGVGTLPASITDLMSYCNKANEAAAWTTLRNWNRAVEFRAPAQTAVRSARAAAVPTRATPTLSVVGYLSSGRARVTSVGPDREAPTPLAPGAGLVLVARDAAGHETARAGVEVDHNADSPQVTRLSGFVIANGAASVGFEQAGAAAPLAARTRSAHAPRVTVVGPRGSATIGRTATVNVRWTAVDLDHDRLSATVDYSSDGGRKWKAIAFGESRGSVSLPRRFFTASGNARVRVRVSDGFNETGALSGRLRSLGAPPEVRVLSPRPRSSFAAGAAVELAGSAYDDAGERLTGARLRWVSGGRTLGKGELVTANGLAPGKRTITLVARDSRGRSGRRSIVVRIGGALPLFTVLRAPKRVSRRATSVTLRVASTFPATLSVGGRRFSVDTRARGVGVPVKPGRTTLNLTLKLTAGGRSSRLSLPIPRS
jgi:hypothetical protein